MLQCMTGVIGLKKDHAWKVAEHILPPSHLAPANIWKKIKKKKTDPDVTGSWKKINNSWHMHSYWNEIPAVFIKKSIEKLDFFF